MKDVNIRPRHAEAALYQIQIEGRLDESWSQWFNNLTMTTCSKAGSPAITTLTGFIADQSALHGLLTRIRNLNLPLLLVKYIERQLSEEKLT